MLRPPPYRAQSSMERDRLDEGHPSAFADGSAPDRIPRQSRASCAVRANAALMPLLFTRSLPTVRKGPVRVRAFGLRARPVADGLVHCERGTPPRRSTRGSGIVRAHSRNGNRWSGLGRKASVGVSGFSRQRHGLLRLPVPTARHRSPTERDEGRCLDPRASPDPGRRWRRKSLHRCGPSRRRAVRPCMRAKHRQGTPHRRSRYAVAPTPRAVLFTAIEEPRP